MKNNQKKMQFKKTAGILIAVMLMMSMMPSVVSADPLTVTVTYYSNGMEYSKETLTSGEKASSPIAPAVFAGNVSFAGWSKDPDGINNLYDFSTPVTENLNLYAQFSDKYLVSFKDADGDIFETQFIEAGEKVTPPTAPPSGTTDVFSYWAINGTDDIYDFNLPVNSNIILKPVYGNSYYIDFNSMKGTPVVDQLLAEGEKVSEPADPTRAGYEFAFWSKTMDAEPHITASAYDFSEDVTESFTLYAIWKANETNKPEVKVIIWKEKENLPIQFDKTDPSNFVYHDSFILEEKAGSIISIEENEMNNQYSYYIPEHSEFYRSVPATVEGDGTTSVNVYYTNIVYTINFHLTELNAEMIDSRQSPSKTYVYSENEDEQYSIQVKLNMNIEDIWPVKGHENFTVYLTGGDDPVFYGWTIPYGLNVNIDNPEGTILVSKRSIITAEILPDSTFGNGSETEFTLDAAWVEKMYVVEVDLRYMFEALPEDGKTGVNGEDYVEYNDKLYINNTAYSQKLISDGSLFVPKTIDGKTAVTAEALWFNKTADRLEEHIAGGAVIDQYLLYDHIRYTLKFDTTGGSSIADETGIIAGEPLSGYAPADPIRDDYIFIDWYEDTDHLKPFDLENDIMPSRNLELYAGWEHVGVTATFYDRAAGTKLGVQNVELYGPVRQPINSDSYYREVGTAYENLGVFRGWYQTLNNGLVIPYDFTNRIDTNVEIYGLYKTAGFEVTYNANGGAGEVPTDSETYKVNALAPVQNAPLIKDGLALAGWQEADKAGVIYYPGSNIRMYGNVMFEAVYADTDSLVDLIYDANYAESPETKTDKVIEDRVYSLRDNQTFIRSGYILTGWSENPNDITPQYACNSEFLIPAGGTTLYAIWEEADYFTVTFAIRDEDQHKGTIASQYIFQVEKGAASAEAIPAASRPAVDITPDGSGKIKYRFTGWDALPAVIQQSLTVYGNFEDIKESGGGGGTGTAVIRDGTNEGNTSEENNTSAPAPGSETGYEMPIAPGGAVGQAATVVMFPFAIAVFFFLQMRTGKENEEEN